MGRFMQTDPIGYGDGLNWYNYAHGDPVNGSDPRGEFEAPEIVVNAILGGPENPVADIATVAVGVLDFFGLSAIFGGSAPALAAVQPTSLAQSGSGGLNGDDVITVHAQAASSPSFDTASLAKGAAVTVGAVDTSEIVVRVPKSGTPNCGTVLPNGQTIRQVVQNAIGRINVMTANGSSPLNLLPSFIQTAGSHGPIDFKNNFKGQGSPTSLAAAGNFAYGAVASGIGLSQGFSEFGAGAYAAKNFKLNLGNPFGEDHSAAQNLPAGYASNGCR